MSGWTDWKKYWLLMTMWWVVTGRAMRRLWLDWLQMLLSIEGLHLPG